MARTKRLEIEPPKRPTAKTARSRRRPKPHENKPGKSSPPALCASDFCLLRCGHARISEREFRSILALFCADVEALKASLLAKVNKNTMQRIYGLLRRRVVELANAEAAPFAGCVEVDESYLGPRRVCGIRGRGASRKIPAVGLLKRGGRVICSPLPNCSKAELLKMIKGHVSPVNESIIFTDGWRGY